MKFSNLPQSGRAYIALVATLGLATLAHSVYSLLAQPIGSNWFVLAALTLITGSATVRLPSVPATISISETFVFTATLLYGPAAGTLTVALDALVISYALARKGHPAYRVVFNICALPASLWIGANIFFLVADIPPLAFIPQDQKISLAKLIGPLILFTACYFGLNSSMIALAISIERHVPAIRVWQENFAWLALNYFGGASVAALLVTYTRDIDYAFIAIVVPLLAVLYFTFSTALGRIEDSNRHLTKLNALYMSTIETLAMAIDAKDQVTHGHIRRVQHYAVELARRVGVHDAAQINAIEAASLLHDMGKLAVPEYILNKPGPLSVTEFEKMKLHASVGADILSAIDFPYPVVPIVRHHHENWDGSGYPEGLSGTDIPIGARILAVVDCFDALTSDRPYRPRLSELEAIRILTERRGNMYDPVVVDTFVASHHEMSALAHFEPSPERERLAALTHKLTRVDSDPIQVGIRFSQINASSEETLSLLELTRDTSGSTDFWEIADETFRQLRRLVPAITYVIYRFVDQKDELVANAHGEHSAHFSNLRIARGQRLSGWVAANLQPVLNSDPVLELGDTARALRPPLKSYVGVPIAHAGNLLGVLAAFSNEAVAFTDEHLRRLEAVARQIGPGISLTIVHTDQSKSATLPGDEELQKFVAAQLASSSRAYMSIVQLRLQRGSRCSGSAIVESALSFSLRQVLRPGDFLFHDRPNQLTCVLLDTDHRTAETLALAVKEHLTDLGAALGSSSTVSVGYATAPRDGRSLSALIEVAWARDRTSSSDSSIH